MAEVHTFPPSEGQQVIASENFVFLHPSGVVVRLMKLDYVLWISVCREAVPGCLDVFLLFKFLCSVSGCPG